MPNYRVTYFNGRGRAEITRLVLTAAGVDFEDRRLADWPAGIEGLSYLFQHSDWYQSTGRYCFFFKRLPWVNCRTWPLMVSTSHKVSAWLDLSPDDTAWPVKTIWARLRLTLWSTPWTTCRTPTTTRCSWSRPRRSHRSSWPRMPSLIWAESRRP